MDSTVTEHLYDVITVCAGSEMWGKFQLVSLERRYGVANLTRPGTDMDPYE